MQETASYKRHPFVSLIYLLFFALAGSVLFGALSILAGLAVYPGLPVQTALAGNDAASIGFLKIVQLFSSAGTFIVPALVFSTVETGDVKTFLHLNSMVPPVAAFLVIILIISFLPMIDLTSNLNNGMKLPGFLQGLEQWMRSKEDEVGELTKKLLKMDRRSDLNINLIVLAALPAIGEEFFFRGCVQQIITRWIKNPHAGIWITAIIFSAIHVQFYGFLPRMLLGALLGYLFYWGKSIWLPVLGHFTNNAVSVIASWFYQQKGLSVDSFEEPKHVSPWLYALSFLLSAILLYYYRSATRNSAEADPVQDGE